MSAPFTANDDSLYSTTVTGGLRSAVIPTLPTLALTDDEQALVSRMFSLITSRKYTLELHNAYYGGVVRIQDLGISIPPQLRGLHTVLGWPRIAVDALEERIDLNGFRYADSPDVDLDLQDIWQANDLESEQHLAHIDALVFGRAYVAVGSGSCGTSDCPPLITVESPLDMAVEWDARSRAAVYALRVFDFEGVPEATLYTPEQTVSLVQGNGGWVVVDRDVHNLGVCPMVQIANRARSYDRDGVSEITPEIMSVTDRASRTLLGLEVAREFYSAPQRYIIGASESAFMDADGNPLSAWQTYMGRVLGLERDEDGNLPTVGQFTPYSPEAFTKVIDMDARIMSSLTGLPPHVLGYTTDNPASADAIRSTEMRLKLKADRKCRTFGTGWRDVMKLALLFRDQKLPDDAHRITAVWADTATPTPAATADSIFKQVQMGYLPAASDVTGEKLGYTPIERQRIEADRAKDQGASLFNEIAHNILAKDARIDKSLASDVAPANVPPNVPAQQ